ncbi:autotransporter domain-containing protein [Salmonella enterica]|nr:autotransporter domain-containing protein [Salmonella enterica]EDY2285882.1 autotransporter domain-containing protein [Salmonella enterica]EDY5532690.1 autotransporter domain-containing protein [Salmonella enterica]EEK3410335.1 autotransporter domain-containing protein [Salmonella enterica]EEK3483267.1 autotransporter domain-containing protein [Salmonella enterica]
MQKKKFISIVIALTLQSYYIPAIAAENNDDEKECPSNISSLPKEKRAKLSPTCLATLPENDNHWGWVAGGVAALVAGVAIGVENNGGGDSTHSYTPPTPDDGGNVTPPDDGGDDNVIPPDDSGDDDVTPPDDSGDDDVTPPDDSGDDDVTPPDDSGDDDVTPPDDSGDDDVTPPDDSGDDDVTPPDDSGDDDVTPPDDSGDDDVTPPDDSGDDDVTPPDDSGDDDDTPTDNSVTTFSNGVTIDKGKDTLAFDSFKLDNGSVLEGAVWNYSEQDDQWQLTTEDGKTLNVTGWDVTDANAAVIEGTQENGLYWKYDSRGYLIIADDNTTVITGDGESHTSDRGMDISGQDRTGVIISGDRTVNTLTGDSSVTDGATGMVISGDGTTNTISGHSTVDNAIGALISGNNTTTDFSGDITVSGGGDDRTAVARADDAGSVIHNQSGGDITIISDQQPVKYKGFSFFPLKWYNHTFYAMLASGYGDVVNDKDAAIHLQGAGVYGVSAIKGAALNAGDIYLDGFVPTLDDEGDITSTSYWHPSSLYLTSAGMVAGSTDGGDGDATATNTGTINVNNAGFGMMALNGGTAINQGTINLTADEGVTKTDDNQLVGMAALNGGTVINDTTGTINIDASYGKPFYADDSSVVVNYGTICVADSCQNSSQYNPTDPMVSFAYNDGLLSAYGENIKLNNNILILGDVGNEGAVATEKVNVTDSGYLTNSASGEITSFVVAENGGKIDNRGKITSVDVEEGGTLTNSGDISDTLTVGGGASAINSATGSVNHIDMWKGSLDNQGYIGTLILQNTSGAVSNTGVIDVVNFKAATVFNNNGTVNDLAVASGATVNNLSGGVVSIPEQMWKGTLNNWGEVNGTMDIANGTFTFYNAGTFNGNIKTASAKGGMVENDGVINVTGNNVVAMSASGSAKMVNNGEINLGTKGTTDTGMIGMQLESNASSSAVIENNGTINIYASNSYAFSQLGSNGHIVNNGTVYIDDSVTGSGFIKQSGKTIEGSGENGDGTEVHYVDFIAPTEPTINDGMTTVTTSDSAGSSTTNNLSGYVVGTSADGSAGKLKVSNASMNGVEINTGFAAGTADTTISFDNVVEGSNLSDAGAIQSTTVVWNAQGSQDSDGNVDVTMTKNAYADVATDASVSGVASALDAGYTNNELYTSLNVGTTAELNNALKQVSGAQATTVFREARILSNRFNMLADAAPQIKDGLAFNVVAKGDPRAELGNDTQYDMLALRQKLDLTTSQNLTLEYGIARLDGDGSKTAGDNGLTGGYSQFFGLKHSMAFEEGLAWNNSLRYDVHNLDSSRSVSYGDTNKVADSDVRQQYLEFRSEGAKTFTLMSDTLKVTPYAGVKFRHTMEDGYKERSAGDFNLSMNSGNETAVDSLVGLKLDYAGKDGWSATATLEGGPNLSYSKSQRTASLQGAAGQSFGIDDGQKGGGVNGLATIGVKYSSNDTALHLDAYQWKEDGISDKGFMLNVKKTFR